MLIPIWMRVGSVLLVVSIASWDLTHRPAMSDCIDAGMPARWPDYAPLALSEYPAMRYLGHSRGYRGGLDVYDCGGNRWLLVGPGRRFTPCTPQTVERVSLFVMESLDAERAQNRLDAVAADAVQLGLNEGWPSGR